MLNKQMLDLRGLTNPIDIKVGNHVEVGIYEGDNEIEIKSDMNDIEDFYEIYRQRIGEPTIDDLEEKNLKLESKIETLENEIEVKNQVIDNLRGLLI